MKVLDILMKPLFSETTYQISHLEQSISETMGRQGKTFQKISQSLTNVITLSFLPRSLLCRESISSISNSNMAPILNQFNHQDTFVNSVDHDETAQMSCLIIVYIVCLFSSWYMTETTIFSNGSVQYYI